ncbi:hypothetical protein SAMN04244553_4510 [Nocardia amikacinitolerans]|uniref:Uncharacterized protein n=1 Tax=Nocardia amikacinitolerans TaxID=756689 RepID=A0A285LRL3_9NOCA|nr:hypothetical protein SAMN04244553_4510 [Nocardia amikacinitolerans]
MGVVGFWVVSDGGVGLRARIIAGGFCAVLVAVVVGPLFGPGYLLLRDAVSTPRSYLTESALGLGDSAPRAVPQDALLATVSPLVDGGLVVKAILVLTLWAAGYGAAVLVRELLRAPLPAQLVAATVALWNPYVAERLLQGHWSLLAGYAALPWTALAAYRLRLAASGRGRPEAATMGAWAGLAGCFAAAGLTPTGALLAGVTALVTVHRRHLLGTLVLLVAASAPWLTATALSGAGAEPSDPAGIPAFAARAEPMLGTLGSLAGLGGIWNGEAVPDSRTTPLALLGTVLLLAIVLTGLRAVATAQTAGHESLRIRRALLALAAASVVLPALAATGWGMEAMEWLVVNVPGAGLLRDTQKYVALAVPTYALCAAAGCTALTALLNRTETAAADLAERKRGTPFATDLADAASPRQPAEPSSQPPFAATKPADRGSEQLGDGGRHQRLDGAAKNPAERGSEQPLTSAQEVTDSSRRTHDECADAQSAEASPPTGIADRGDAKATRETATAPTPTARRGTLLTATLFIAFLILPLFDLTWGVGNALRPVHYPPAWHNVAQLVTTPGDIAVLPGGMFRKFPYSGAAPVLDPAPRMLPNDVLQTGELPVRGRTVSGEGTRARDVETLLLQGGSAQDLASLGVEWVLVERTTPGPLGQSKNTLAQLDPVYSDDDLALYRVPGNDPIVAAQNHRWLAITAHLLWAALLIGGPALAVVARRRSRTAIEA